MSTRTDADYEAMADAFEHGAIAPDGPLDVAEPIPMKAGRPAGRTTAAGATPSMSVRIPADLRQQLDERAKAENVAPAEVIRRAVRRYLSLDDTTPA